MKIEGTREAGYSWLISRYGLEVMPNWHRSLVEQRSSKYIQIEDGNVEEHFPLRQWPGDTDFDHLEFALKYDGVNLQILQELFRHLDPRELAADIGLKPYGKYSRKIWYLFELLTGREIPLIDLDKGNYEPLLDPDDYIVNGKPKRIGRQRIVDNMLGDKDFCPQVRRTNSINQLLEEDYAGRCRAIYEGRSREAISRAMAFLYTKETKSSFALENLEVSADRAGRFIALLKRAESEDFCNRRKFIELQGLILDHRFAASEYRDFQNYVGESNGWQTDDLVHYIPPPPEILEKLMNGLERSHKLMSDGNVNPLVHAGIVSFAFVYHHPFEDGNGRIHRFLVHNILARRGFTEPGFIFPISAAMLSRRHEYDTALELLSRPLMGLIDYYFRDSGTNKQSTDTVLRERKLIVNNYRSSWYSYPDLTGQVEALGNFVKLTIEKDLAEELAFLESYDQARLEVREIVDLPDLRLNMFIRLCKESGGTLSRNKRRQLFEELSDEEVQAMEAKVRKAFGLQDNAEE